MAARDALTFLRAFAANPMGIGAVAPSSRHLAKAISAEITPGMAPVLELGPGTGIFTQALLGRGLRQEDLMLMEADPGFARMLAARFPRATIINRDATDLTDPAALGGRTAGAIVSGLPLVAMSSAKVRAIVDGAFRHLRDGGALYQFTYRPMCPVPAPVMNELKLDARMLSFVLRNIPPAAVFRISRKA